jgi:hypothetical protein
MVFDHKGKCDPYFAEFFQVKRMFIAEPKGRSFRIRLIAGELLGREFKKDLARIAKSIRTEKRKLRLRVFFLLEPPKLEIGIPGKRAAIRISCREPPIQDQQMSPLHKLELLDRLGDQHQGRKRVPLLPTGGKKQRKEEDRDLNRSLH